MNQLAASQDAPRRGPMTGLRVLDFTSVMMGPFCTQLFADMGADVIKVESPEGDSSRKIPPLGRSGDGGAFRLLNRGKRSVVLDLRQPAGRDACLDLVRTAHVMIHSMRPAAIKRLGLHYEAAAAVRPDIVYCNLLGFGRGGRYAGQAAYDDTIQALSGMAALQEELTGQPGYVPTVVADKVGGLTAAYAVLAALLHRQRSGEGQEVDMPMFETMSAFLLVEHLAGHVFDPPRGERPVYRRLMTRSRHPFRTRDGQISVLVYNDKQWHRFARLVERPELIDDVRFRTLADRSRNVDAWNAVVAELLAQRSTAQWLASLSAAGIPAARVNSTADLLDDPHLADVGFFQSLEDERDGMMRMPGFPVQFSRTPGGFDRAGPALGQHTDLVLREAGLSVRRIARLREAGVLGRAENNTDSASAT